MIRTPLFRQFLYLHALCRRSRLSGVPIDDLNDRARALKLCSQVSRRTFIQRSGQLSAASSLPGVALIASACRRRQSKLDTSIAIVGAGLAGLTCAYRLHKQGISASIFDAAPIFGGRVQTDYQTFSAALPAELGGEFISSHHQTMQALARELDIELLDYDRDEHGDQQLTLWVDGKAISTTAFLKEYAPVAMKIDAALAALTNDELGVSYQNPNGGQALDRLSMSKWLDRMQVSGAVRKILEAAYTVESGLDPEEVNALNLLLKIGTETRRISLYGDTDFRYRALAGNGIFIRQLTAALSHQSIFTEHRLAALNKQPDGRYLLTFERANLASSRQVICDHVVLALPFQTLRQVAIDADFPDLKTRAIAELAYGQQNKLLCSFNSKPWRTKKTNGTAVSDLPFQTVWDSSRLLVGDAGLLTNVVGGTAALNLVNTGTASSQAATLLKSLEAIFPRVSAAFSGRVLRVNWTENPTVSAGIAAYRVGDYTRFAGCEGERVANVHFCGEHTSRTARGTMEGAAQSGEAVAAALLEEYKQK